MDPYSVLTIYDVLSTFRTRPLSYCYGTFLSLTVLFIMYFPQKEAFCLTSHFMFHGRKNKMRVEMTWSCINDNESFTFRWTIPLINMACVIQTKSLEFFIFKYFYVFWDSYLFSASSLSFSACCLFCSSSWISACLSFKTLQWNHYNSISKQTVM